MSLDRQIDLAQQLELHLERRVDLIDLRQVSGIILQEILLTGKLIWRIDLALHSGLISRMLAEEVEFTSGYRRALQVKRDMFFA